VVPPEEGEVMPTRGPVPPLVSSSPYFFLKNEGYSSSPSFLSQKHGRFVKEPDLC
jgi:hypothetical protein